MKRVLVIFFASFLALAPVAGVILLADRARTFLPPRTPAAVVEHIRSDEVIIDPFADRRRPEPKTPERPHNAYDIPPQPPPPEYKPWERFLIALMAMVGGETMALFISLLLGGYLFFDFMQWVKRRYLSEELDNARD